METLEQRQLLAPVFGFSEAAGLELNYNNKPPLVRDPSLSPPPVGLNVPGSPTDSEVKSTLASDSHSDRLIVKIV